jgi:riboflavin synthase
MMFTGIIQNQGKVVHLETIQGSLKIHVDSGFTDLELGESIAVNGVCLTVTEFTQAGQASFFISPETLQRSNLSSISAHSLLNLERALTLQTRLSGHIVQGHVDGQAKLIQVQPSSDAYSLLFEIPMGLAHYCVEKGSITLNGVSLTINSVSDSREGHTTIGITLIPHTWTHTNLSQLQSGDLVNVEVDILAKYMERLLCRNSTQL